MSNVEPVQCTIYRCSREPEMYVYVDRAVGLERVPDDLQRRAGKLSEVMTIELGSQRKLARVKARDVLAAIAAQGYYLQLPPDLQPAQFTMGE